MAEFRINIVADPTQAVAGTRIVNRSLAGTARQAQRLRGLIGTALGGAAILLAIRSSVRSFAEFERALIGVGKTTNATDAELASLGVQIRELSRILPVSAVELADISRIAGQLGVRGNANILRFAETVGRLGLATNLHGEQAASALARILTVTGDSLSEVDRLGAVIVRLGNNFAATESEIAVVATRVAQATAQFNVASRDVAGIAAALRQVGVQAELGGTVVNRAFQAINKAVRQGGSELRSLEQITGQTGAQIRATFAEDSVRSFQDFIGGLNRILLEGGDVNATLRTLNLEGVRVDQVLGTLAARSEVLNDALAQSREEWVLNRELILESARATTSFIAQMQLVSNVVDEAAAELGSELVPVLLDAALQFRDFILEARQTGELQRIFQRIAQAVSAVIRSFQSFASAIRAIGATLDVIALALEALAIVIVSRLILGLRVWAAQAYAVAVANAAMTLSAGAARVAIAGLSRVMALLGGPIGVAALAAFAIYEFASANSRTSRELPAVTEAIDRYRESLQNLNNAALAGQEGLNVQRLREGLEAVNDIRREIDEVTSRIDRQQGAGAFRALQFVDDRERLDDLRIELNDAVDIVEKLEGRLTAVRVARNQATGDPQERPQTPTPILGLSEDQLNDLENLRGALDPIGDAQVELVRSTELLNTAFQVGEITLQQRDFLLNQLTNSLRDQINPLDAILRQLDEERSLLHLSGVERAKHSSAYWTLSSSYVQSGIQLSGEELADLRERIRLNAELSDLDRRIAEQERARLDSQRELEQKALAVKNARAVEEVRKSTRDRFWNSGSADARLGCTHMG